MKVFRITALILLISWMILIFCLSSQTATESSDTSGKFITMIIRIFRSDFDSLSDSQQLEIIGSFQFIVRKMAHFTAYAILGIFSFFTYITYSGIPLKIRLIIIPLTCLLYSLSDEIHQTFIPGRSGELRDVCIDFCGSLLSIAFLYIIARKEKFRKYIQNG